MTHAPLRARAQRPPQQHLRSLRQRATFLATIAATERAVEAPNGRDEPDPIFLAIEKYRHAEEVVHERTVHDEILIELGHRPGSPSMSDIVSAVIVARGDMANTVPTTLIGLAAYTSFLCDNFDVGELLFDHGAETLAFIRSLAVATRTLSEGRS